MSFLAQLQKTMVKRKPSFVFFSPPGGGKTSLAAEFKNVVFAIDPHENGINDLKNAGLVREDIPVHTATDFQNLCDFTDELYTADHPYEWLAIDSFTGVERMLWKHVADTQYDGNLTKSGFFSYGEGPKVSQPILEGFLDRLERLRDKGMGIIVLAHSIVKPYDDPVNGRYDKYQVDCHEKSWGTLSKWAVNIGFLNTPTTVNKEGIAQGGRNRFLYFNQTAAFEAKNRCGIYDPISMGGSATDGFRNLCAALVAAKKNNTPNEQAA